LKAGKTVTLPDGRTFDGHDFIGSAQPGRTVAIFGDTRMCRRALPLAAVADSKYDVQNSQIGTLLGWINSGEIGLPELQRPFVWPSTKVRDLIDSLFNGFPIGYIITWNNPSIRLKDGSISVGKKIVIDGQ
ncbi:DUF262 domain-containing protein, partial [Lactiplantibacillus plantarum]|uniref:DUF262 domain-containing protein n=1 Tax=Lactiplantibacillus plantarum TaxID=1590 RepID=UPI003852AC6F